jgi:hypothetical protein
MESDPSETRPPVPGRTPTKRQRSLDIIAQNHGDRYVKATTRETNMQIQRAIWKNAIAKLTGGNDESESLITTQQIVQQFLDDANDAVYSKPSYNRYKSALLHEISIWIEEEHAPSKVADYIDAKRLLLQPSSKTSVMFAGREKERPNAFRRSSELRIGRADLKTILNALEMKGEAGRKTLCFCKVSIETGLRPAEWKDAYLQDDGRLHVHRVKGHKFAPAFSRKQMAEKTVGRPVADVREADQILIHEFGAIPELEIRAVRILDIEPESLNLILEHLRYVKEANEKDREGFNRLQAACSKYLKRICEAIWNGEKTFCLYSFRHQFAANSKRVMSLTDVKLVLGSNSAKKYAGRSESWKGNPC